MDIPVNSARTDTEHLDVLIVGAGRPWKLYQNYALGLLSLRFGSVRDQAMVFSNLGR